MRRRRFLARTATVAAALGLAGCTGSGPAGGGTTSDGPTETSTDTPTPTDSPTESSTESPTDTQTPIGNQTTTHTPTPQPTMTPNVDDGITDHSFELTDGGCGGEIDDANISFDTDTSSVAVTGTIWGHDACQSARLATVELEEGTLTLTVSEFLPEANEDKMCADCIVELDYESSVTLADGLPDTVKVVHSHGEKSETVATASP